jgi:alkyl hydroperoxide reductase subunit F
VPSRAFLFSIEIESEFPMLDEATKAQLKSYLERATQPIEIVASLDDSEGSGEMLTLLKDIAALSDKITLTERPADGERAPSFSLNRTGSDMGIRFAGLPMGHEFTSLVLALLQVGGYPPKADAAVIEQIKNLEGEFRSRPISRCPARTARKWCRR